MQRVIKKIKDIFKNNILQNEEDIRESLSNKEVKKINKIKQDTEILKATEKAKIEEYETKTNIEIKKAEQDERKLETNNNMLKKQVSNIALKCKQARQKRALSFFNIKNEALEEEMKKYKEIGKKQASKSFVCSCLSAGTTCIGLLTFFKPTKLLDIKTLITTFTIAITIYIAIVANGYLQELSVYIQKVFDGKSENKMKVTFQKSAVVFHTFIICTYTIYSIITNYMFWEVAELGTVPTIILACILDFMSIGLALTAPDFQTLNVNSDYKKEIIESIESVGKSVNKTVNKSVATLDKQGNCDTSKNKRKTSASDVPTQDKFNKKVFEFVEGTKLSPKKFNMTNCRDVYYKLLENCPYVEKINNSYYRKNEDVKFEVL